MWNWDDDQPWNNQEPLAPDADQSSLEQDSTQNQSDSDANQAPLDLEQSQLDLNPPQADEPAAIAELNTNHNEVYINDHLHSDEHYNHIIQNVHSVDNDTGHGSGFSESSGHLISIRHAVDDSATFTSDDTLDAQAVKNFSETGFDDNGHVILEASKNHSLDDLLVIKDNAKNLGDGKGLEIAAHGTEIHKNDQVEIYHNRDGSTKETSGQIVVAGEGLIHIDIGEREKDEFHGASGSPVILNNEVCGVIVGSQINQDNGHTELIAIAIGKDENGISVDYTDHHLGSVRDSIHEDEVHQVSDVVYVVPGEAREEVIVTGTRINDDNGLGSLFNNLTKNYFSGNGKSSSGTNTNQPAILGMLDNAINDLKKLIAPKPAPSHAPPIPESNENQNEIPPEGQSDDYFTIKLPEHVKDFNPEELQSFVDRNRITTKDLVALEANEAAILANPTYVKLSHSVGELTKFSVTAEGRSLGDSMAVGTGFVIGDNINTNIHVGGGMNRTELLRTGELVPSDGASSGIMLRDNEACIAAVNNFSITFDGMFGPRDTNITGLHGTEDYAGGALNGQKSCLEDGGFVSATSEIKKGERLVVLGAAGYANSVGIKEINIVLTEVEVLDFNRSDGVVVKQLPRSEVPYNAPTGGGSSGSPVFRIPENGPPELVGIHWAGSGEDIDSGERNGYFVPVTFDQNNQIHFDYELVRNLFEAVDEEEKK